MTVNVTSIQHLKQLLQEGNKYFYIRIGCAARSSKYIFLSSDGKFNILNEIDGSNDVLTEAQLADKNLSNIGYAIDKGLFFCES